MVFARKSRAESRTQSDGAERRAAPSKGRVIDPFAGHESLPDAAELAEKVVFKLWSEGSVKGKAIEQARREAGDKMRIDQALTRLRLADPEEVAEALAELLEAPMAGERDFPQSPVSLEALPARFIREALALPLSDDGAVLSLAMADPLDDYALRAIAMKTRRRLAVKIACANRLEAEIDRLYPLAEVSGTRALPTPQRAPAPREALAAPERSDEAKNDRQGSRAPARQAKPKEAIEPVQRDERLAEPRRDEAESAPSGVGWKAPNFLRRGNKTPARPEPARDRAEPPSQDMIEDAARGLAEDLDAQAAPSPSREAKREPRQETAPQIEREEKAEARMTPPRPKFIRPKRVTLKDKTDRSTVSRGSVHNRKRALRRAPPADMVRDRHAAEQDVLHDDIAGARPGEIAAQVREQVAARRAEREKAAAEGRKPGPLVERSENEERAAPVRGVSKRDLMGEAASTPKASIATPPASAFANDADLAIPRPDRDAAFDRADHSASDDDAPLRFGEIRGHAAAARAKTSPTRRKVLDRMREAIARREAEKSPARSAGSADDALSSAAEARVAKPEAPKRDAAEEAAPKSDANREEALRYQAAAAMQQREQGVRPRASSGLRMPRVETLKRFGFGRKTPSEQATDAAKARPAAPAPSSSSSQKASPAGPDESGLGVPGLTVDASARAALEDAKQAREGLILLSGPSGSGKIETVRRLAEHCAGARATPQRFDQPGAKFPRDVEFRVYWGEIRDAESAEAAARAAMTGALVVATLDAASAAASPARLVALGLPPYALASSLRSVLSQSIDDFGCTRCAETGRAVKGGDCEECGGVGRNETVRLGEAMLLDDATRALVLSSAPEEAFRHAIRAASSRPDPIKTGAPSPRSRSSRRSGGDARL